MKLYRVDHRELLSRGDKRVTVWHYIVLAASSSEAIEKAQNQAAPLANRAELRQYFDGTWSAEEGEGDVLNMGLSSLKATDEEVAERKARLAARQSRKEQAK